MIRIQQSLLILCLSCCLPVALALDSDQQQQLFIAANTADLNSQTGVGVYSGAVTIDQGTTHIRGDKVTAYSQDHKITQIIVTSSPTTQASYETTIDVNKPTLIATADIIKFYPDKKYAILLGNAHVQQGTNSISGAHLEYDVDKKILKSLNTGNNTAIRTHIVIDPNNLPKMDQKTS